MKQKPIFPNWSRPISGEEIIIAKAENTVARLVPLGADEPAGVRFGLLKGEIEIAEDFDAPLPAVED